MINFISFSTENDLLSLFLGSELNLIFHWKALSLIFIKSLFRSFAVQIVYILNNGEQRGVIRKLLWIWNQAIR